MTPSDDRSWARAADRLGRDAATQARPTGWLEALWSSAERDEIDTPWDRREPFPDVAKMIVELGPVDGRRAVVVGAAWGADAEALARAGWDTVAFDVSPAAVRLVRQRYPSSDVDYRVGDLLDLSDDLVGAFDLVVEVFTVQAMPPTVRAIATEGVRRLIAPGGTAIVVQYVRGDADPDEGPPWLLNRTEMELFGGDGVDIDLEVRPSPRTDDQIWAAILHRA